MATASVSFTAPASNGGSPILSYTVTSTPGNITATGTVSPIVVTGLTGGNSYNFTVHATNANGNGLESVPSNSVITSSSQSYSSVELILNSVQLAVDINNISLTLG
jgi:glycerate kinase